MPRDRSPALKASPTRFVTSSGVERERAEVVLGDRETDTRAHPVAGLGLGGVHECRADPLPPVTLRHDESRDLGVTACRVDRDATDDVAVDLGHQHETVHALQHRRELRTVFTSRSADIGVDEIGFGCRANDDGSHSG